EEATPAERAVAVVWDALHAIAVTQLFVLALQRLFGLRWPWAAGCAAVVVLVASPFLWTHAAVDGLPLPLAAYVNPLRAPSQFPLFPYAAFVLAGTAAGALLGRAASPVRRRRALVWGIGLMGLGGLLAGPPGGRGA